MDKGSRRDPPLRGHAHHKDKEHSIYTARNRLLCRGGQS